MTDQIDSTDSGGILDDSSPRPDGAAGREVVYSKPLSSWYKWMLIFCTLLPLSVSLGLVFFVPIVAFMVFLLALFIKAVFFSKEEGHWREGFFVPSIVLSTVLTVSAILSMIALPQGVNRIMLMGVESGYWIQALTDSFEEYKAAYGRLPEMSRWCDDLLDVKPELSDYFHPDSTCDFAMNKYLSELEGAIPADMVVLFDAGRGWNLSGGPELARGWFGSSFVRVITGDWTMKKVHVRDVPYLRWRVQDSGVIPPSDMEKPYAAVAIGLGLLAAGVLVALRKQVRRWLLLILFTGLLAMGVGMLFGFISEEPLYTVIEQKHVGWLFGGAAGVLAGVCFVPVLGRVAEKLGAGVSLVGWGTMIGTIVGIVCSCVVHGLLMIAYRETSPVNMAVGTAFGAWAGTMLGWITAGVMGRMRGKAAMACDRALVEAGA